LARLTSAFEADDEAVWSWRLDAGVNSVTTLARCTGDGDTKPITRESAE
jgi:hypothetical protein